MEDNRLNMLNKLLFLEENKEVLKDTLYYQTDENNKETILGLITLLLLKDKELEKTVEFFKLNKFLCSVKPKKNYSYTSTFDILEFVLKATNSVGERYHNNRVNEYIELFKKYKNTDLTEKDDRQQKAKEKTILPFRIA